jgi:hypothetical protein
VFEKHGYRFDAGPSLFLQPQNIEDLFAFACEDIHQYLSYKPVILHVNISMKMERLLMLIQMHKSLLPKLKKQTGEPAAQVVNYLNESKKIYTIIGSIFYITRFIKKERGLMTSVIRALAATRLRYIFST